jgi:hypothetical protein
VAGIGLSVLGNYLSQEMGTPVPSVMSTMIMEGARVGMEGAASAVASIASGTYNPVGPMSMGIGTASELGKVVPGGIKIVQSVLSLIPFLGNVIGGLLASATGKTPVSPYYYYDPVTRQMAEGTQLGEPLNQFDAAARQWAAVKANLDALIIKKYASSYGLTGDMLIQTREIPGDFGVPFGYSEGASDAALAMVADVYEKGGGIENFLNPTEKRISDTYTSLFFKEANPILGGPSEYMVYLASQGI